MPRAGSGGRRRSRGTVLDTVEGLTMRGVQFGGGAFAILSLYLLWGVISGSLVNAMAAPQADQLRIWENIRLACKILTAGGIVLILSASIKYYGDELAGYILLIGGALLHWGIPGAVGSSLQQVGFRAASLPAYVASQFSLVGTVALLAAAPLIMADFWLKLRGVRRTRPRAAEVVPKKEKATRSRVYLFCWQMPYCRDYLREFCKAYEERRTCWRIKSGCYCDEDLVLRVMKRSATSKLSGFDQRFTGVGGKSDKLTPAQKRQRCRQCFLYTEHQRQKYRILSPLAVPIVIGAMWLYLIPARTLLRKALAFTDQFAGYISFKPGAEQVVGNQWANAPATSSTVEGLFLICIGLIILTYVLRGLEYCIFDLQV